ncbi:MAG: Hsp20/alpha crystallin family protein [Arcanobacterium sp.]|nr:Hsp20/alpha crystallin family protein [Arcanobacterium sp.]MDY5589398.1 Hsp20/alpha crystallin family protein [Arcanobacterium sp.]
MAMFTNDPFRGIERMMNQAMRTAATGSAMGMDLYRSGDNFVAKFDMPGVDPESIDIDVDQNALTVRASRKGDMGDDIKWLSRERFVGTFARQLSLGYGLDTTNITADYTDGVLTLTIPVAEESKPRKVAVSHAGAQKVINSSSAESESHSDHSEQN